MLGEVVTMAALAMRLGGLVVRYVLFGLYGCDDASWRSEHADRPAVDAVADAFLRRLTIPRG